MIGTINNQLWMHEKAIQYQTQKLAAEQELYYAQRAQQKFD